jgi:hypothetical protein
MRRWMLALALCFSIGCVKGRCYENFDCPSPQICIQGGMCVFRGDASTKSDRPEMPDAGEDEMSASSTDTDDESEAATAPGNTE